MKGTLGLPEIPLALNPATPEGRAAVGFKWAPGNVGRRDKIGGSPDWLQETDFPSLPGLQAGDDFLRSTRLCRGRSDARRRRHDLRLRLFRLLYDDEHPPVRVSFPWRCCGTCRLRRTFGRLRG